MSGHGIKIVTGLLNIVGGSKVIGIPIALAIVRSDNSSMGLRRGLAGYGKSKKNVNWPELWALSGTVTQNHQKQH